MEDKIRDININVCYEALDPKKTDALQGFHTFTECNRTVQWKIKTILMEIIRHWNRYFDAFKQTNTQKSNKQQKNRERKNFIQSAFLRFFNYPIFSNLFFISLLKSVSEKCYSQIFI